MNIYGKILTSLSLVCLTNVVTANTGTVPTEDMQKYFDSLDASIGMPKGMTEEYVMDVAKRTNKTKEESEQMVVAAKADICSLPEMNDLCNFMGKETLYKVRNLAWTIKSSGGSNQEVLDAVSPIMEYGITKNLETLYGDTGLADSGERSKLVVSAKNKSALCFGLPTAIHTRNISTTNPFYGQNYRLVTCAAGLNWYHVWSIMWWEISVQVGAVMTHSRFSRRIGGLWHLTGADKRICSTAYALGNTQYQCNDYNWSSPISVKSNVLINQSVASVYARGYARKLGKNFNTQINF